MTKVRRPYSRVYWEVIDDPKFADVWDDDRAVASWLRLLVAADMAWPASASLYHGVNRASLDKLCRVGLVDMQTGGRYRIHGLDKEREARSRQASDAAAARWDDDEPSHPAGNAAGMHRIRRAPLGCLASTQSREEQSQDGLPSIYPRANRKSWTASHLGRGHRRIGPRSVGCPRSTAGATELTAVEEPALDAIRGGLTVRIRGRSSSRRLSKLNCARATRPC
jgi:hypothetical protein